MGWDNRQSEETRQRLRDKHLKRLDVLQEEGRLLLAGPIPQTDLDETGEGGILGSLILAEFEDLEQAKNWANEDPYTKEQVYKKVEVFPFVKRLP